MTGQTPGQRPAHADSPDPPSWDVERERAPQRPAFSSSLPEEIYWERPRRVIVAFVLGILVVLGAIASSIVLAMHFEEIRDALVASLPEDVVVDYEEEDVQRVASIIVWAAEGLGILLALFQLLALRGLTFRRSGGARAGFVVLFVLALPVTFVSLVLREAGTEQLLISGAATLCGFVAVVLVCTSAVTRWLRQNERRRTIPLARPEEAAPVATAPVATAPEEITPGGSSADASAGSARS